ncbi:hypothetical protein ACFQS7_05740 [Dankookia sp. GCM10030260]|uniref:hypothetical protein n=1 Tax=Dankookia sp. GCM10030260 TaxID=3273390 RepID=UPI00361111EB
MEWMQAVDFAAAKAATALGDASTGMLLVTRIAAMLLDANLIKMGPLILLLF